MKDGQAELARVAGYILVRLQTTLAWFRQVIYTLPALSVACHRGLCYSRYCLFSTLLTWSSWSKAMVCRRTSMLMTFQYLMCTCSSRRVCIQDFWMRQWHCGLGEVNQADVEPVSINCQLLRYQSLASKSPGPDLVRCSDLGIYIYADLYAGARQMVSRCFAALCQLRQIRQICCSTNSHVQDACSVSGTLATGLWNAVLVGIPAYLVRRLQCSMLQWHDSSTICIHMTTSLTRWRHCTGCTFRNVCSIKSRC